MRQTVLVLGGGRAALAVVRALRRKRFRVVLGIPPGGNLAAASAHTEASWGHPPLQATKDFHHALAGWCQQQSPPYYLFPATEVANDCLTQGRAWIPAEALIVAPSGEVIETCRNKESFYQLAERIGLPLPRTRVSHTPQELLNHANDLGYPCLIKPARSAFQALGWKAAVCTGPKMVQQLAETWPTSVEAMLVQQLLRGWRYNCQFVATQGNLLTYFEHLVIRTDRFDDTGLMVEGSSVAPTPEHFHATRALARELRYTGPGCLQVLCDHANDTWGVLELNPRLAVRCGI
jgi:biotin carboxylase